MALTDAKIRGFKPESKDVWLSDERGLRLLVKTNGSKYWRLKYRFQGKQSSIALGVYPEVSLKQARMAVDDVKAQIAAGVNPGLKKKQDRLKAQTSPENTFSSVARNWWEHQKGTWTDLHAERVWARLKDNAFPLLGERDISEIHPQEIITTIRNIEHRGAHDVASRVLQDIGRVCRYGVQFGLIAHSPAAELKGILKGQKSEHRASLPRSELPGFLRALDNYQDKGRLLTRLAIELLVLTFVRPGELRGARWDEFDLEERVWRIPGERMKMGTDHIVPLSEQSLKVLERLRPISGQYELVFPSERSREQCMSDNTMRRAIFKLGYDGTNEGKSKVTPHGFRATASSILNESNFNPDAIERQLSHQERNGVRAAYTHHARYLEERAEMMSWWGNYIEEMRGTGKVVPINSVKAS